MHNIMAKKKKQYLITVNEGKEEVVKAVLDRMLYVTVEELKSSK